KGKLFQKPSQHEEERFGGLDLMIELKTFVERFRRLNKFQEPRCGPICPFPKPDRFLPEPRPQFLFIQRSQLPQRMNPPLVENAEDFLNRCVCNSTLDVWRWAFGVFRLGFSRIWPHHATNLRQITIYVQ